MSQLLDEAKAIDSAIYAAIAASDTPSLDSAMRRLSRAADHGKLWFAIAAALALLGGPGGRLAARRGLVSLGIASGFANLLAKPLTTRRRPARQEAEELARRHVQMPRRAPSPPATRPLPSPSLPGRQRAADSLSAVAGRGDAGRLLEGPYRCPLSGGRARRRLHRGQRGGGGRPPAGPLIERADYGHPQAGRRR